MLNKWAWACGCAIDMKAWQLLQYLYVHAQRVNSIHAISPQPLGGYVGLVYHSYHADGISCTYWGTCVFFFFFFGKSVLVFILPGYDKRMHPLVETRYMRQYVQHTALLPASNNHRLSTQQLSFSATPQKQVSSMTSGRPIHQISVVASRLSTLSCHRANFNPRQVLIVESCGHRKIKDHMYLHIGCVYCCLLTTPRPQPG